MVNVSQTEISEHMSIAMSGLTKMFVGEVVETGSCFSFFLGTLSQFLMTTPFEQPGL